ncbi:PEP-CTERM sorting domain-containing protein [Aquabacterium sp.]|uniref:PEP-CTERM sorting domain-containing protein n=1 Tax=Aquabacterium sp. TaxID=1872578 RepID=UPI004037B475
MHPACRGFLFLLVAQRCATQTSPVGKPGGASILDARWLAHGPRTLPEPTTYALMGLGPAGLVVARRRQAR